MDLNRKKQLAKRAYTPFFFEARYNLITSFFVSIMIAIIFVAFSISKDVNTQPIILAILSLYISLELLFVYKTVILALIENKKCLWEEQLVVIKGIKNYKIGADPPLDSVMSKIYPKRICMNRYKVICQTENGKKIVLKTALGHKKLRLIEIPLYNKSEIKCKISYGKYSKIIIRYKGDGDLFDKLNYMI